MPCLLMEPQALSGWSELEDGPLSLVKACTLLLHRRLAWPPGYGILAFPSVPLSHLCVSNLARNSQYPGFSFPQCSLNVVFPWSEWGMSAGSWVSGNRVLVSCSSEQFSSSPEAPRSWEGVCPCPSCPTAVLTQTAGVARPPPPPS